MQQLPSKAETIAYLHAALGFPTKETLLSAVRAGYLASWPGLTVAAVNKYFPESDETQKGHMKHQRKGVRSTKVANLEPTVTEEQRKELEVAMKELKQKQRDIYVKIWEENKSSYTQTKLENFL